MSPDQRSGRGPIAAAAVLVVVAPAGLRAQATPTGEPQAAAPVVCASTACQRQHCPADTPAGGVVVRSAGTAAFFDANKSPVSSTFGYLVGGQTGQTLSVAYSVFF